MDDIELFTDVEPARDRDRAREEIVAADAIRDCGRREGDGTFWEEYEYEVEAAEGGDALLLVTLVEGEGGDTVSPVKPRILSWISLVVFCRSVRSLRVGSLFGLGGGGIETALGSLARGVAPCGEPSPIPDAVARLRALGVLNGEERWDV